MTVNREDSDGLPNPSTPMGDLLEAIEVARAAAEELARSDGEEWRQQAEARIEQCGALMAEASRTFDLIVEIARQLKPLGRLIAEGYETAPEKHAALCKRLGEIAHNMAERVLGR